MTDEDSNSTDDGDIGSDVDVDVDVKKVRSNIQAEKLKF
jgi:hypothetical protein